MSCACAKQDWRIRVCWLDFPRRNIPNVRQISSQEHCDMRARDWPNETSLDKATDKAFFQSRFNLALAPLNFAPLSGNLSWI